MIEESGRVVAIEDGAVWVETRRGAGCGRCDEPGGCGNGVLARRARERTALLRAQATPGLAVGDEVVVGVPGQALLRGTLVIYVVPVLAAVGGALAGAAAWPGDAGTLAGLLAGLALAFAGLRLRSGQSAPVAGDAPRVLRRAPPAGLPACSRDS